MPTKSEENKPVIQHLDDALRKADRESTSPGADVRASRVAREKAVMTRLMMATVSGLISGLAAICATMIYSCADPLWVVARRRCHSKPVAYWQIRIRTDQ